MLYKVTWDRYSFPVGTYLLVTNPVFFRCTQRSKNQYFSVIKLKVFKSVFLLLYLFPLLFITCLLRNQFTFASWPAAVRPANGNPSQNKQVNMSVSRRDRPDPYRPRSAPIGQWSATIARSARSFDLRAISSERTSKNTLEMAVLPSKLRELVQNAS